MTQAAEQKIVKAELRWTVTAWRPQRIAATRVADFSGHAPGGLGARLERRSHPMRRPMAVGLLLPFANWLNDTPLAMADRNAVRHTLWVAPVDETLHILAICTVVGCTGVLALRLMGGAAREHSIRALAGRLLPLIWGSVVVLLVTGSVLVMNRPARYFRSEIFLSKMGLLTMALVWTVGLAWTLRRNESFWESSPGRRTAARANGVAALVLWFGVIAAGRWIAYA